MVEENNGCIINNVDGDANIVVNTNGDTNNVTNNISGNAHIYINQLVDSNIDSIFNKYKQCNKCKEHKLHSMFYHNKSTSDGLQSYCKDCNRVYMKKYMNDNVYSDKTSDKYNLHKMRCSLSRGNSLGYITEYLGCSNQFFVDWLNYQRIISSEIIIEEELDHVLPIKEFGKYPDLCWFWANIKPVSQTDNRHKSAKVDNNLFLKQLYAAKDFFLQYDFTSDIEKKTVQKKLTNVVNKYIMNNINQRANKISLEMLKLNSELKADNLDKSKIDKLVELNLELLENLRFIQTLQL